MLSHYRLNVQLTLEGPLLTKGNYGPPGIDAPLARDARGRVMLPFSLVKGKVLDALRELYPNDNRVSAWLGKPTANGNWEPERGRVRFSDFITDQPGTNTDPVLERIQVDQASGATAARMLLLVEAPFGYGEEVTFTGHIDFIAEPNEAREIEQVLGEALRWVPAYGAYRSVGFGRTKKVTLTLDTLNATPQGTPTGVTLPVQLSLDRPLCIVGKKHAQNHFNSLECIPGSVLKGATARLLLELAGTPSGSEVTGPAPAGCAYPKVWEHLSQIRIGEARPILKSQPKYPVEPPLSVVWAGNTWHDVALLDGPQLIGNEVPAFAPDWKWEHESTIRRDFGWVGVHREIRTRTAIDPTKWRAMDSQLFSYGLVVPDLPDKELVWETTIGLERVPQGDQSAVRDQLAKLYAHGLPNIGKTRACASVNWLSSPTVKAQQCQASTDGLHVVTLQTEFLMTDPDKLTPGCDLKSVYQAFWDDIAPGEFKLVRFFARQSLHGGFLRKRYGGNSAYEPYLLTDRGSVFVLTSKTETAKAKLLDWSTRGLPLPNWAKERYAQAGKQLWQICPYVPEIGFGEIAWNLTCHKEKKPK